MSLDAGRVVFGAFRCDAHLFSSISYGRKLQPTNMSWTFGYNWRDENEEKKKRSLFWPDCSFKLDSGSGVENHEELYG